MTSKASVENSAVAASAPVTLLTASVTDAMVSVAVGLIGVWLARIVFINRENRRLNSPQPLAETLPITLAGCLIAGVIIWDRDMGISTSAFTGLGVGWTTVLLLELFGDRITNALRGLSGAAPLPPPPPHQARDVFPNVPEDMGELLRKVDQAEPDFKAPK